MVIGDLVGGRYRLGDRIGQGCTSVVYRGWDERLGRPVAVKALRAGLAADPSHQVRFRLAAQSAATLNDPAIVAVYDSGETAAQSGPVPYTVMEYVDGQTLRELLGQEGRVPPRRAMEIAADVCAALDFAHRHGIVHRDVRPATIMVTRAGAVKVMDFGVARTGYRRSTGAQPGIGGVNRPGARRGAVPLARAGPWRAGGCPLRCVRDRVCAVRVGHRGAAVHR